MSLKIKLAILFSFFAVIPMVFTGMIGFTISKNALLYATTDRLNSIVELREAQIYIYLDRVKTLSRTIASGKLLQRELGRLTGDSSADAAVREGYQYLTRGTFGGELLSLDLLDRHGEVIVSSVPGRVGRDDSQERYFQKALGFEEYVTDFHVGKDGERELDVSIPIAAANLQELAGVLVSHYNPEMFNRLLSGQLILGLGGKTQARGIGATGESFLVSRQGVMVTDSMFLPGTAFRQKVDTYPTRKCFGENKEVSGVWKDYRGVDVIGASMCLSVGDFRWTLVAKQDVKEAFAVVFVLQRLAVVMGIVVAVLIGFTGFVIADFMEGPIMELTRATKKVAQGETNVFVPVPNTRDEVDALARSFNTMIDNLSRAGKEIQTEVNIRREAEEKFRGLVEAAPDAVVCINKEGEIILVNTKTEEMFGFARVELIGKKVEVLMPERFHERHIMYREKYFENPCTATVGTGRDLFARRKSGTEFPIEVSLSPVHSGGRLFAISTVRNISARMKVEQDLLEKTERLQRFQNLSVGRELEMIALKREINSLLAELGRPPRFTDKGASKA